MNDPQLATLRPVEGCRVRDPATGAPLPTEGAAVPLSPYWLARLAEGAVERIVPRAPRPIEPPARPEPAPPVAAEPTNRPAARRPQRGQE